MSGLKSFSAVAAGLVIAAMMPRPMAAGVTPQGTAVTATEAATLPEFDAVSVKPNHTGEAARGMGPEPGGRFGARNVPLRDLVAMGYGIPPLFATYRIAGGPEWLDSARFDVTASSGRDLPPDQVALRVRRMLADRFSLTAHWETRETPVYALVIANRTGQLGSHLRKSDVDCAALRAAARGTPPPTAARAGGTPGVCTGRTIPGTITGVALSIETLASSIGRFAGRIVQNRTGLVGGYDYELTWTPDQPVEPTPGATPPVINPNGPSLVTAVQEQLGLRLDAQRAPVEVLVVDSAERPSQD